MGGSDEDFLIGRLKEGISYLGGSIRNFSLGGSHKDFLIGRLKQGISYLGGSDKEFLIRRPTLGWPNKLFKKKIDNLSSDSGSASPKKLFIKHIMWIWAQTDDWPPQ